MALTQVWWKGTDGEWTETNAQEADKRFDYSVSVNSTIFRCYKCYKYVTFVKGTSSVSSHFKHSRGDIDKDCEDRRSNANAFRDKTLSDEAFPLRLQVESYNRVTLQIGFLPISQEVLASAEKAHGQVTLFSPGYADETYRINSSRFSPYSTTWIDIPWQCCKNFSVRIEPKQITPILWNLYSECIKPEGTLFDGVTGRRIYEKGDALVNRPYYFLTSRYYPIYPGRDIDSEKIIIIGTAEWIVYKLTARQLTDDSSDFFFDTLHVRLTNKPAEICVAWPPVIESDCVINTSRKYIYAAVFGRENMRAYPSGKNFISEVSTIGQSLKLYHIINSTTLQMICTERFCQTVRSLYICAADRSVVPPPQPVVITDDTGKHILDPVADTPPVRGIIIISSGVNGSASVYDSVGFCYRKEITGGTDIRISGLTYGMSVIIHQGVRQTARFTIKAKQVSCLSSDNIPPAWTGKIIPFPDRYAWILEVFSKESPVYPLIQKALLSHSIPSDGWKYIRKLLEEK